jgi:hypothetical protein
MSISRFEECHSNNERINNKFRENGAYQKSEKSEKLYFNQLNNLNKNKFHNDKLEKKIFK